MSAAVALGFTGWLLLDIGGALVTSAVEDFGLIGAAAAAMVSTGLRSRKAADQAIRRGWLLLSVVCALLALSNAVTAYDDVGLHRSAPIPSFADVLGLAGLLTAVPAVLLLSRTELTTAGLRRLLDGGIVASALLVIAWVTTLHSIYRVGAANDLSFAVLVAYPIADVVVGVIILGTLSGSRGVDPSLLVVAAGVLVFAAGDTGTIYLADLGGRADLVTKMDHVADLVGYLLIAIASLVPEAPPPTGEEDPVRGWQVLLPIVPLFVASLVVLDHMIKQTLDLFSQATLGVMASLALVRQGIALVESHALLAERNLQAKRARNIQRHLLPQAPPSVIGYQVAGTCRPAQEVGGDFYDWVASAEGRLDFTIADVMGKGMGAALIMAALRTALRGAPSSTGPAGRLRQAAAALPAGMEDEGLFVTVFQGRLDTESGGLQYVDAGHGYCAIRRPSGELIRLTERSLPLGVDSDDVFKEGRALLEPGDALIVYSDGLVETPTRTRDLSELTADLRRSDTADEMVWRLMRHAVVRPADDVTVVVLRRVSLPPAAALRPRPAIVTQEATISPTVAEGIALLTFSGRLDIRGAADLQSQMEGTLETGTVRLVVDLGEVSYIDDYGLGSLVRVQRLAERAGGGLHLARPSKQVMTKLRLRSLDRLFRIYDCVDAARDDFHV